MNHNQKRSLEDQTHYWKSFPLEERDDWNVEGRYHRMKVSHGTTLLMGHYFLMVAHGLKENDSWPMNVWVADLRDNCVKKDIRMSCLDGYKSYSLNKYGENQMIQFGGKRYGNKMATNGLHWITIESFEPFEVRIEDIQDKDAPHLAGHTAEIYEDCLYVFGGRNKVTWCFDLKKRTWKLCETTGEFPKEREGTKSFIKEDNLYIYGGYIRNGQAKVSCNELHALNLKTMKWRKIEQIQDRFSLDINGNHLKILKDKSCDGIDKLYYRHILENWSTSDVTDLEAFRMVGNSVIYKNMFYICATTDTNRKQVALAALSLDNMKPPPLRSAEEEQLSSLFMNESESDIIFKVQAKTLPAHKKVLIQKSQYFANLFNSGMMESRLEIIDINDCEYDTLQGFLRFLYCGIVDASNDIQVRNLLALADKYRQEDLYDRSVNIAVQHLTSRNVCEMLDLAREHDIAFLRNWCLKIFKNCMNVRNITRFVVYLEHQSNLDYEEENSQLLDKALAFTLTNLSAIIANLQTKKSLYFYQDFLIKHISTNTIVKFKDLFRGRYSFEIIGSPIFSKEMTQLREAVLDFCLRDPGALKKGQNKFEFGVAFREYKKKIEEKDKEKSTGVQASDQKAQDEGMLMNPETAESELSQKENDDRTHREGKKRMEPISSSIGEDGPTLKKTKKSTIGSEI